MMASEKSGQWLPPTSCYDCESYPPNLVVHYLSSKTRGEYFGIECRDCGDYYEEFPVDDFFSNIEDTNDDETI